MNLQDLLQLKKRCFKLEQFIDKTRLKCKNGRVIYNNNLSLYYF